MLVTIGARLQHVRPPGQVPLQRRHRFPTALPQATRPRDEHAQEEPLLLERAHGERQCQRVVQAWRRLGVRGRDLPGQREATLHRGLARPGIAAVTREGGDEGVHRDVDPSEPVGEARRRRIRLRRDGRAQGPDVRRRVRVSALREALREESDLDETRGRPRLLPEGVHGVGQAPVRIKPVGDDAVALFGGCATRKGRPVGGDGVDLDAVPRHPVPVDGPGDGRTIGAKSGGDGTHALHVEHRLLRHHARERELDGVAVVRVDLLAHVQEVPREGRSGHERAQQLTDIGHAPGVAQRAGERLLTHARLEGGGVVAQGPPGGDEDEIDVVDLPDLHFREHGGQGGQDRGHRALVHLVGLHPLQEDPVGGEP